MRFYFPQLENGRRAETYHVGVDGGLLDVSGDAGDKSVSVLEVGVEVGLLGK